MSSHVILEILVSNAAVALLLALAAVIANGLRARPALVHALWVLVLLKLVTPPIYRVPIELPESPPPVVAAVARTPVPELPPGAVLPDWLVQHFPRTATEVARTATPTPPPTSTGPEIPWLQILLGLWVAGGAVTLLATGRDLRRMRAVLRRARPAPASLQSQVDTLAKRLGMRRAPEVSLIPAKLSPMLWAAFGSPRMLLPEGLLDRLEPQARTSLLVHELAHMRRRDHWVRYLEVVVRTAYWWNPLVWWACHQLRIAEEECCDGWVLWALPRAGRSYADALLETVEFLSGSPTALPAAASGVGRVQNLKRRLTMIMQGNTRKSLTRRGRLAVLSTAALALPLIPVHGQSREELHREHLHQEQQHREQLHQEQLHLEQALHEHNTRLEHLHQQLEELKVHAEQLHQSGNEDQLHEIQDRMHAIHSRVSDEEEILANLHTTLQGTLHIRQQDPDRPHQHPEQEVMLDALHKAIDALRSREQFDEAELLANLADDIGRQSTASDNRELHLVELERALADERDRRTALELHQREMEADQHAMQMDRRMAEEMHQREMEAQQHAVEMDRRIAEERHQAEQHAVEMERRIAEERSQMEREAERHAVEMEMHMAEQRAQMEREAEMHMVEMQRHQSEAEAEARAREHEVQRILSEREGGQDQNQIRRLEARIEELAEMIKKLAETQAAGRGGRNIR